MMIIPLLWMGGLFVRPPRGGVTQEGSTMVKDPVCGIQSNRGRGVIIRMGAY